MVEFISAKILKQSFAVFGHFYSIHLGAGEQVDCASVLEIVSSDNIQASAGGLMQLLPDAIFVMMNPGSSTPLAEVDYSIQGDKIGQLEISLVPTKPDSTQYQIMRVMYYCDWKHVRIVNISDIRDAKSGSFTERYSDLEYRTGFTAHSLFANARENELNRKLKRKKSAPIVCAWGVSAALDFLIRRCLKKLGKESLLFGLLKPGTHDKYYHPLPSLQKNKEKWVDQMVMQLNCQGEGVLLKKVR